MVTDGKKVPSHIKWSKLFVKKSDGKTNQDIVEDNIVKILVEKVAEAASRRI